MTWYMIKIYKHFLVIGANKYQKADLFKENIIYTFFLSS